MLELLWGKVLVDQLVFHLAERMVLKLENRVVALKVMLTADQKVAVWDSMMENNWAEMMAFQWGAVSGQEIEQRFCSIVHQRHRFDSRTLKDFEKKYPTYF